MDLLKSESVIYEMDVHYISGMCVVADGKGLDYQCLITSSASLYCFGSQSEVVDHVPEGSNWRQVGNGLVSACALDQEGEITCW